MGSGPQRLRGHYSLGSWHGPVLLFERSSHSWLLPQVSDQIGFGKASLAILGKAAPLAIVLSNHSF